MRELRLWLPDPPPTPFSGRAKGASAAVFSHCSRPRTIPTTMPTQRVTELTNFEVLHFLQLKNAARSARHAATRRTPAELATAREKASAAHTLAAGISAASALGPVKVTQTPALDAVQSIATALRHKEIRWTEKAVLKYLGSTPAAVQTRPAVVATLRELDNDGTGVGQGQGLDDRQKLQLVNLNAVSVLKVFLVVQETSEERAADIAEKIASLLPQPPSAAVAAAAAASAPSLATEEGAADGQAAGKGAGGERSAKKGGKKEGGKKGGKGGAGEGGKGGAGGGKKVKAAAAGAGGSASSSADAVEGAADAGGEEGAAGSAEGADAATAADITTAAAPATAPAAAPSFLSRESPDRSQADQSAPRGPVG